MVSTERTVEVDGRRLDRAAGIELQLAQVTIPLERSRPQPLPPAGAIAAMLALTIAPSLVASSQLIATMSLAGHHDRLANADLPKGRMNAHAETLAA